MPTTSARPPKLAEYHRYRDSVRWRVTARGVAIERRGVERTPGPPVTVTRVWEAYSADVNAAAKKYGVPAHLIVATICTESTGRADAIRFEPRYVSDETTPHQVSPGLMQTLISTARGALGRPRIDRRWLFAPRNSIMAGTAYIASQAASTKYDPPLVAAAYNAGRLVYEGSAGNRWKLRQYPIGTSEHCDRFVKWLNDAAYVLARHRIRPAVGLEALIGESPPPPFDERGDRDDKVCIAFGPNADRKAFTRRSRGVLSDILRAAGQAVALVSSTSRSPAEQARVMFENLERLGGAHQKALYGPFGDEVIDVYVRGKAATRTAERIRRDMERRIVELGPTRVSRHAADPRVLNVFDVAPSSIANPRAFERAVRAERRVSNFLTPPNDPGYHLEIPQ